MLPFYSQENAYVFIFCFMYLFPADLTRNKNFLMFLPVCTLSPICSSDIVTDFPFLILTVATDGKQPSTGNSIKCYCASTLNYNSMSLIML